MSAIKNMFGVCNLMSSHRNVLSSRIFIPTVISSARIKTKTVEEKLGLPLKPKKPLIPFFKYAAQVRPALRQNNPKAHAVEIIKLCAKKWEVVDEQTKTKLEEEYKKEQVEYATAKMKYDKLLTNEQRDEIKQYRIDKADIKSKRALKKKMQELGRPKRPATGYLRFMLDAQAKHQGDLSHREWQLKAAKMWADLDEKTKLEVNQQFEKEKENYKKQMLVWEEKMVRLGHIDIVRNEALIEKDESKPKTVRKRVVAKDDSPQ